MKKWPYMIPIYAYLVKKGKYAISEEDKQEGQKVVPEIYQEDVALYIAEHSEKEV
ncbi:CD1375 family protein [Selenomonas artemidis]|uniref:CD1375 family protein n=1 Tax=Selenomonas artemidis TaxID=671224 RepID=UPI0023F4FA13|nr:CD1375 family protein [Selenomonas artemidis]